MTKIQRHMASLSLEAVDFQTNPVFFNELTMLVGQIRALNVKSQAKVEAVGLAKAIERHTGINASFQLEDVGYANAWVYPPSLDINHVLLAEFWRYDQANEDAIKAIRRAKGAIRGAVNRTTGKVSGVFTQFTPSIHVTLPCFRIMSDEEIAAVILHEIGHCMSFFEMLGVQMSTNMALKAAYDTFSGKATPEQRYEILQALEDEFDVKFDDKNKLKESRPEVVTTVFLKKVVEASRSEGGTPLYDLSGWEFMSDQYAARMGAGRAQVTALDKLMRDMGGLHIPALRSGAFHLFMEAYALARSVLTVVAGAIFLGAVGAVLGVLMIAGSVWLEGSFANMRIYDDPEARLKRLRNQLVESLKVPKLPNERRQEIVKDIAIVDGVTKDYSTRKTLYEYVFTLFSPNTRQQEREMVIQQELEKLVSNDLYVMAAKLQTMTTA